MAKIELPYVQRFKDRHGKLRHYFRKPGFQRVALPGAAGSAEFMDAYQAAEMAARPVGAERIEAGSMSAVIVAYYHSAAWKALGAATQDTYRRILDRFREEYGAAPAARLDATHVRRILDRMGDKPGAALSLLKRLRGVCRFAVERGLMRHDPTKGVAAPRTRGDGFRAWTDADISKFEAKWGEGTRARLALYLLLYTGQRRSDVVRMGPQHLDGDGLRVVQQKTGAALYIPLHPSLKAELAYHTDSHLCFLTTAHNKPFTPAGFYQWFASCARAAKLPAKSSPHGLRKAAARWLAEAGCSASQIAAITGHKSLKEVERYTKSAAQHKLATAAIASLSAGRPNR